MCVYSSKLDEYYYCEAHTCFEYPDNNLHMYVSTYDVCIRAYV